MVPHAASGLPYKWIITVSYNNIWSDVNMSYSLRFRIPVSFCSDHGKALSCCAVVHMQPWASFAMYKTNDTTVCPNCQNNALTSWRLSLFLKDTGGGLIILLIQYFSSKIWNVSFCPHSASSISLILLPFSNTKHLSMSYETFGINVMWFALVQ